VGKGRSAEGYDYWYIEKQYFVHVIHFLKAVALTEKNPRAVKKLRIVHTTLLPPPFSVSFLFLC